jgi:hypothetical protein
MSTRRCAPRANGSPPVAVTRTSKPILELLGFETVCEIRMFVDHTPGR